MNAKSYYIYVLLCADQTLYTGYTDDVERRFATHQAGKGAKYTRINKRHPLKLVYSEEYATKSEAMKAEYAFKHQTRSQKIAYLNRKNVFL